MLLLQHAGVPPVQAHDTITYTPYAHTPARACAHAHSHALARARLTWAKTCMHTCNQLRQRTPHLPVVRHHLHPKPCYHLAPTSHLIRLSAQMCCIAIACLLSCAMQKTSLLEFVTVGDEPSFIRGPGVLVPVSLSPVILI